ncbi:hypothetical protein RDI58_003982 [Solanum bulbocastanum]|uniref:DUF4216 domain-containing protein n=1 Tax=Solanum bulbocastanum TaxID=147425 RepID=A0AAN8U4Y7_SOLBU
MKLSGYKSHDALLAANCIRKSLPKNIAVVLIRLGNFFKGICIKEHKVEIDSTVRLNAWTRARIHNKKFVNWFKEKVEIVEVPNHLGYLAKGPNRISNRRYTTYFITSFIHYNEFPHESLKRVEYLWLRQLVVLLVPEIQIPWMERLHSMDYHFVLASQVHQVFYVEDPTKASVYYATADVDIRWSREDIPGDVVHMTPDAQFLEDTSLETLEEYDDND